MYWAHNVQPVIYTLIHLPDKLFFMLLPHQFPYGRINKVLPYFI